MPFLYGTVAVLRRHCGISVPEVFRKRCYECGYIPLKAVSQRQNISDKYLEQIITQLSRAGLVRSARGAQGGYQLTKPPEEYTVGDILRTTEGSLAPVSCLEAGSGVCEMERHHSCGSCETVS